MRNIRGFMGCLAVSLPVILVVATASAASATTLAITTSTLNAATVGSAYTASLAATGGAAPYSWSVAAGSLAPAGMKLSIAGVLSGTPTTSSGASVAAFTVSVKDSSTTIQTKTATISIKINADPMSISTTSLTTGVDGAAYSQQLKSSGGTGTVTWKLNTGSLLVTGVQLSAAGLVSGTPTASTNGAGSFAVTASDSASPVHTATSKIAYVINPAIGSFKVTTLSLLPASQNLLYSAQLGSAGGIGTVTWSLASGAILPTGLKLALTGLISGTPTVVGTSSFWVQAKDSSTTRKTVQAFLTLVVQPVAVTILPLKASVAAGGKQQFTASVSGTTNTAVKWSVNSISGGNSILGSISTAGLYVAPATAPSPAAVTITATSTAASNRSASAPVTITSSLAQEDFNYTGTYATSAPITYVNMLGKTRTIQAYPGQVFVEVAPSTSSATVAAHIQAHGGSIIAQLPNVGMYWAGVTVGAEAKFIAAFIADSAPTNIAPNPALYLGQTATTPTDLTVPPQESSPATLSFTEDVAVLDDFKAAGVCSPTVTHGSCVGGIVQALSPAVPLTGQPELSVAKFQIFRKNVLNGKIEVTYNDLFFQLNRLLLGAAFQGKTKVVNLSIVAPPDDGIDRHSCFTEACLDYLDNQALLMSGIYDLANRLADYRPYLAIALAVGNSGLDLSAFLDVELVLYPNANVLVVGGLDEDIVAMLNKQAPPGPPPVGYNSARDAGFTGSAIPILYAPAKIGGSSGTSFSAPQAASRMAALLRIDPSLTGPQLVAMMKAGSINVTAPASSVSGLASYDLLPSIEQALFPPPATYTAPFKASTTFSNIGCSGTISIDGTLTMKPRGNPYLPTTGVPAISAAPNPSYYLSLLSGTIAFNGTLGLVENSTCPSGSGTVAATGPVAGAFQSFQGQVQPILTIPVTGGTTQVSWTIGVSFVDGSISPDLKTLTGVASSIVCQGCTTVPGTITFTKQ